MTTVVEQMIDHYHCVSAEEYRNAMKEVVQEIALLGLSRGNFFQNAAFYGGTALRIFYGLDRFSEDMDFSLCKPDPAFQLDHYFPYVQDELAANGFEMMIERKVKDPASTIQSAFLKGGTLMHLLKIVPDPAVFPSISSQEIFRIKFEIDINPPDLAAYEIQYRLVPSPYAVKLYDEASLFSGKLHALLCRGWKNRVKGRDFYDYLWYLSRKTQPNLAHLKARLVQSGNWKEEDDFTNADLKELLMQRFSTIDFLQARNDVRPFVRDMRPLELWNEEFFQSVTKVAFPD